MVQDDGERLRALEQLREELILGGRNVELEALDQVLASVRHAGDAGEADGDGAAVAPASPAAERAAMPPEHRGAQSATGSARPSAQRGSAPPKTYLKLRKKFYTPAEVARRVGVSRQTIVKWIERGELEAELTPGGHHRIPSSVFHREGRGEAVQLIPVEED